MSKQMTKSKVSRAQRLKELEQEPPVPQLDFYELLFEKAHKLLISKRQDYATNPGILRFSNFQMASDIANITPEESLMNLIGIKVARLSEIMKKGKTNYESVEDNLIDLINYSAILADYLKTYKGEMVSSSSFQSVMKLSLGL